MGKNKLIHAIAFVSIVACFGPAKSDSTFVFDINSAAGCLADLRDFPDEDREQNQSICIEKAYQACRLKAANEDCLDQETYDINRSFKEILKALPPEISEREIIRRQYVRSLAYLREQSPTEECSEIEGFALATCHFLRSSVRIIEAYRLSQLARTN